MKNSNLWKNFNVVLFASIFTALFFPLAASASVTANDMSLSANEDVYKQFAFNVTGTSVELEGIQFVIVTPPANGTVQLYTATQVASTGFHARYRSNLNYNGPDSFSYQAVTTAGVKSDVATVTMKVVAVNDVPLLKAISLSVTSGSKADFILDAKDADGESIAYNIPATTTYGAITTAGTFGAGGTYSYKPNSGFTGTDTIAYAGSDGKVSRNATITATVTEALTGPVVTEQALNEDTKPIIRISDASTVTYKIKSLPANGQLIDVNTQAVLSVGGTFSFYSATSKHQVKYAPKLHFNGKDSFTYEVLDSAGQIQKEGLVNLTVKAVNDRPVLKAAAATTKEDTPVTVALLGSDVDGDALEYGCDFHPKGEISIAGNKLTFTPRADFSGTAYLYANAIDGVSSSTAAKITITVTAVNDAPVAEETALEAVTGKSVGVLLRAYDVEGENLTYALGTPAHGTLSYSSGTLSTFNNLTRDVYTPAPGFSGADEFSYTVIDSTGLKATSKVKVSVSAPNLPPVAKSDSVKTDEDVPLKITLAATDDGSAPLTFELTGEPVNGTAELVGCEVMYTPNEGFQGSDKFEFTASDGTHVSESAAVAITVENLNDVPVAQDVTASTPENVPAEIDLIAADPDGDELRYLVLESDSGETGVIGSKLTFTPAAGFGGTAKILYQATDGGRSLSNIATVMVTVEDGVNDPPVARDLSDILNEDRSTIITLFAEDPEKAELTYDVSQPANGSVVLKGNEVTYTPEPDFYGSDSFTFTASDGTKTSNTARVELKVNAIPDPVIRCDKETDSSHVKTHGDPDSEFSLKYIDNLVSIVMDHVATPDELDGIQAVAGTQEIICSLEQPPLTEDEAAGITDPSQTAYGLYTVKVTSQSDLAGLEALAAELRALSYVSSAAPVFLDEAKLFAAETDAEESGYQQGKAIENKYFKWIQLKGVLDYLRAYEAQAQGEGLDFVQASLADTGVCFDESVPTQCFEDLTGPSVEFAEGFRVGRNFIGTLSPTLADGTTPQPAYRLGAVDLHADYHGTTVASLMAAESNGNSMPVDAPTHSGILGSVWGLNFELISYLAEAGKRDYTWTEPPYPNPMANIIQDMCGHHVTNHSYGVGVSSYEDYAKEKCDAHHQTKGLDPCTPAEIQTTINRIIDRQTHWGQLINEVVVACPQTLYVNAAGNESQNLDLDSSVANAILGRSMSSAGVHLDNSINVQAAGDFSYEPSEKSNYGNGVSLAAPGYWTSYAAPIVTGAAGVLKAIDKSLFPRDIKLLLENSGRPNSSGTPFLDMAAATILAIKGKMPDFVPMASSSLSFQAESDLADSRATEGYVGGTHVEIGKWDLDEKNKTLTVERNGVEKASDGAPGPEAGGLSATWFEWQMMSSLRSVQRFELGISEVKDKDFSNRRVPVQTVLPKGSQSHELKGKFHAYRYDGSGDLTVEDHAQAYCFQLDYDVNKEEFAKDGKGFHVPLALNSASFEYKVPFKLSQAILTGNVIKKVHNDWNPETTYDEEGAEVNHTASDSGDATGYLEMSLPSCLEDVTGGLEDNSAEFNAWVDKILQIKDTETKSVEVKTGGTLSCSGEVETLKFDASVEKYCPEGWGPWYPAPAGGNGFECWPTWKGIYNYKKWWESGSYSWGGGSCDADTSSGRSDVTCTCEGMQTETKTYEIDRGLCDGVNKLKKSSPWAPEEVDVSMRVEATFGDADCALLEDSFNEDLNLSDEETVRVKDDYLQVFAYRAKDAGSVACKTTAQVTVTTAYERVYASGDEGECDIGTMTRVTKTEDSFAVDVTWNFNDGEFPAKDLLKKIGDKLPSIVDDYATWVTEEIPGNRDSYEGQSPFDYLGSNESHFLPETLLFGGFQTPGFGLDMDALLWAHGIGPVKPDSDEEKQPFKLVNFRKLDRTVK